MAGADSRMVARRISRRVVRGNKNVVAYALYRDDGDSNYLRQFFVTRENRRRAIGARAMEILLKRIFPQRKRVRLDVLARNYTAHAFYHAIGFRDYCERDAFTVTVELEV
jgi:predicted GNAT family acetyltransferase